ncbi:hypothetical protein TFLX_00460 [Thermoflexales bacterium]|nr:hypothetical protein TFLX_00460 [Thermoflexales bacterium]
MDELAQRLSEGDHPITSQRYKSAEELKQAIERGYVLVKFTDTRGGTELGLRLEQERCDLSRADFAQSTGTVQLAGTLTLNYIKVRGHAQLELATLNGTGHLEIIEG